MPAPLATARNKLLARLHCIRRDQGWSEDEYRDILEARTGRRSAGDLDERTIARLVASLDPKAAQKSAAAARRYPPHEWSWVDTAPEHKRSKLRKLIMLAKGAGIAKGHQVAWCEGIARQMAGVAGAGPIEKPLAMCGEGELWRLIQAVAVHVQRKGGDPNAV